MFGAVRQLFLQNAPAFGTVICLAVVEGTVAQPPAIKIDVSAVPTNPTPTTPELREITAAEVLLRATRSANTAGLLDQEADSRSRLARTLLGRYEAEDRKVDRQLLSYSADEIRNRAAGLALEGFFRLIEADGQLELLHSSTTELDELLRTADKLQASGLKAPADLDVLRRKRAEILEKAVEVRIARETGSMQLRTLLGFCDLTGKARFSPKHNVVVIPDETSDEEAVAVAMKYRADLNLLRMIHSELTPRTLPRVRQLLASVSVMLVAPQPTCRPIRMLLECVFGLLQGQPEVESVRKQILSLLVQRETQAANEVRADLRNLDERVRALGEARDRVNDCNREVAEWERKSKLGMAQNGELQRAKLDLYSAQSQLLHQAVEWEIARAGLRQHQGLLLLDAVAAGNSMP